MISIIGHTHTRRPEYLFIGQERQTTSRKKSPLQMVARYFGL